MKNRFQYKDGELIDNLYGFATPMAESEGNDIILGKCDIEYYADRAYFIGGRKYNLWYKPNTKVLESFDWTTKK